MLLENWNEIFSVVGVRMGETNEVKGAIVDQLHNVRATTAGGRVCVDDAQPAIRKGDPDGLANSRFEEINRQTIHRSAGGRRL